MPQILGGDLDRKIGAFCGDPKIALVGAPAPEDLEGHWVTVSKVSGNLGRQRMTSLLSTIWFVGVPARSSGIGFGKNIQGAWNPGEYPKQK